MHAERIAEQIAARTCNEDDPAGTCFETNRETDHGQAVPQVARAGRQGFSKPRNRLLVFSTSRFHRSMISPSWSRDEQ